MLRITIGIAAICLALGACKPADEVRDPAVNEIWVRLPAAPGRPAAAYFTVEGGTVASVLKGVSSPQASNVEIHESRMEGGVMRMAPLKEVPIPVGGELVFEPGGKHLMLFGLDPSLKPGDVMTIRFDFEPPVEIVAEAEVRGFGEDHEEH